MSEQNQDGTETFRGVVFPWQCDAMGHLSVQHQMPFLDGASYHLLAELGPMIDDSETGRLGWADIRHAIEYRHELLAGDLVVLRSGVLSIGNSSLRFRTTMFRLSDNLPCTILEGVSVRFDLDARCSVPLSDKARAAAAALLIDQPGTATKQENG